MVATTFALPATLDLDPVPSLITLAHLAEPVLRDLVTVTRNLPVESVLARRGVPGLIRLLPGDGNDLRACV